MRTFTLPKLTILLALAAAGSCGKQPPARRDIPVPVLAETVSTQPITDTIDTVGHVEAQVRSRVGSVLPGRLVEMTKDVGDLVAGKCGDPAKDRRALLARLDTRTLEATLRRLEAEIRLAEANRAEARRKWTIAEKLYRQKVQPVDFRDAAKAAYDVAAAQLDGAKAARDEVRVRITQSRIYAPVDAVVIKKLAHVGDVVRPGQALYQLECIRDLKIQVIVRERDVPSVKKGQVAEIRFDALPGRSFPGRIHALIPSGDPLSHSFIAEIRFRNHTVRGPLPDTLPPGLTPDDLLVKPGMFARIQIVKYQKEKATVVPRRCVIEEGDRAFVFVITNGRARKAPVVLGVASGERVEILQGLRPGQRVVGRGIENVTEGQPVRVLNEQ